MKKFAWLTVSGLLIGLSFPTVLFGWKLPWLGFLAWFGLVPLFWLLRTATIRQSFCYGFGFGLIHFLFTYYWIFFALHRYGGVPPVPSLAVVVLLAGAMALYPATACLLARTVVVKREGEMILWLPIFWTLLEAARNYTPFGGFPWANLSLSQTGFLPAMQIADCVGMYGVIFLIVWFNVWLTELLAWKRGESIGKFGAKTVVTALLLVLVLGYGGYSLRRYHRLQTPALKVGLIQPNIPQEEKWVDAFLPKHQAIFRRAVSRLQDNVDLIVWPETSWFETALESRSRLSPEKIFVEQVTDDPRPHTLLGLSFFVWREMGKHYTNSAALLNAQGEIQGKYHKVHLVPFGEYIPLKKWLAFLKPVAAIGDFLRGERIEPLALGWVRLSPLICFEDIFPELTRAMVRRGAHLLVNMTNDAWYGRTSAAYQHLALAQFRAVETRRAMVRATNTGITAVIDPTGRIVNQAPWFEESVLVHRVPLLSVRTVYTKLGNWFVIGCLLLVLVEGLRYWRDCKKLT